ncbi:MAG TPA: hypothetical protein VEF76_03190 [Patescibacteria group bacterium]|nr:hypothetical protein [Patescibacteria group bacterium]
MGRSLAESFRAVAIYNATGKEPPLADFKTLVAGLRGPQRKSLFLHDIPNQIAPDYPMTPEVKAAMKLLTQTHASGFSLTIVEASHNGKKVYLPVIDDAVARKTLVIGPVHIAAGIAGPDTVYVAANDAGAAKVVNDFLKSGATLRGEKGLLHPTQVKALIANFFDAAALMTEPGPGRRPTLGDFLVPVAKGEMPVVAYSIAVKAPAA